MLKPGHIIPEKANTSSVCVNVYISFPAVYRVTSQCARGKYHPRACLNFNACLDIYEYVDKASNQLWGYIYCNLGEF